MLLLYFALLVVSPRAMDAGDSAAIAAALKELGEDFDPSAGFAVYPKTDCPHVKGVSILAHEGISMDVRCSTCSEDEVWVCGTCSAALCSRYKNKHMVLHAESEGHPVGLSLSDLSFWCFQCNSYLDVYAIPELHALYAAAHVAKFGEQPKLPTQIAGNAGSTSSASASSSG
eukprot:gb/GFBE01000073.1/.p1 GENE.gb/GFBE01000073.1/~~gb/GFBE01000073.1/.p1  ORF type:complete len:172 (+),score=29.24 gb/GFBE01000073.1/:1-516(+)